ncbi:MAG: polysaccharide pyruvyl transferase family protein [Candidatus Krumholzibacteria bacterium]|nr:polysaccharide pyruvyl transferase family protein [Candidatus Krumholzibacteria bacterium]
MKLYYHKDHIGNFGDDLNLWLWPRVFGDVFDDDDETIFIGIGTLLNHAIPPAPHKIVFGSGCGYGEPPIIDGSYNVYFVRGPRTAGLLGLDPEYTVTDPAILIRDYFKPSTVDNLISLIPHHFSDQLADWKAIGRESGLDYICPAEDVQSVITRISQSAVVITESMHGAIIADALRIPWIPYKCYPHIAADKWWDWCEGHALEYKPVQISPVYDAERHSNFNAKLKNKLKRNLKGMNLWRDRWHPAPPVKSSPNEFDHTIEQLRALKNHPQPVFLSHQSRHDDLFGKVCDRVNKFRSDYL